jgi:nitroreductase
MEIFETINSRHSTREYLPEAPSDALIECLLDAAIRAPCAVNRQPWHFTVVSNRSLLDEISRRAKAYMTQSRPLDLPEHLYEKLTDPQFHVFYRAPTLIVVSANQQGPWIEADCALAAQNLMLAARAKGLGSCWIGLSQPFLATDDGRKALQIPASDYPIAPIVIGKPNRDALPSQRKPVSVNWVR